MRNNYTCATLCATKAIFTFLLIVFFCSFVKSANAQTLYRAVSASQLDMDAAPSIDLDIKSEGAYLIKDGLLDEIYNLKLILPTAKLKTSLTDSLIGDKKITFEQTCVMVLPIMGMVHVVGTLDVGGVRNTTSFQLGFLINSDQSITFKGTKFIKLSDYIKEQPVNELKLDIDFVLKNSKNNLAVLTAK